MLCLAGYTGSAAGVPLLLPLAGSSAPSIGTPVDQQSLGGLV
jgi:hypothetical protein